MTALLILIILYIGALGYLVAAGVDRFTARGGIAESPQGRANRGVLLYGSPQAEVALKRAGVKCRVLTEPSMPQDGSYTALLALSEDDAANLALCRAAFRLDPGICIVARCATPELQDSFREAGAGLLLGRGEPADTVIARLFRKDIGI
ncbi:MAG TPA: hypothetical protein VN446_01455 [Candidatus Acidoferrum sp.]|nr:hypothetical protein [Candidatus Acidoferrum sp.]